VSPNKNLFLIFWPSFDRLVLSTCVSKIYEKPNGTKFLTITLAASENAVTLVGDLLKIVKLIIYRKS
jgi:hypothetical protein